MGKYIIGVDIGTRNLGMSMFLDNGGDKFDLIKLERLDTGIKSTDAGDIVKKIRIILHSFFGDIVPGVVVVEKQNISLQVMQYTMMALITVCVFMYPSVEIVMMHSRDKFVNMPNTYEGRKLASTATMLKMLPKEQAFDLSMKYGKLDDIADAFIMGYCYIDKEFKIVCPKPARPAGPAKLARPRRKRK